MPYTPPSQRSPAVSATNTPSLSRRSSYQPGPPPRTAGASIRPDLPRSASYLTKHRRTPSIKSATLDEPTPPSSADNERLHVLTSSASLRQSPPPRTDESQVPAGAVLSPPDSAQDSSDDEDAGNRGGLELGNLAQLQEAIRVLAEKEGNNKDRTADDLGKAEEAIATALRADDDPEKQRLEEVKAQLPDHIRRKISHTRSNTDTVFLDLRQSPEFSTTPSDDESISDDDGGITQVRPAMLRKKSGELVRPALRPSSARRRPSSMPGTPTFGKAVHFDSHLEHVRHFLQVDRPLAVSAGSSPVEAHEGETEFPFHEEPRGPPFEWELVLANFPVDGPWRMAQPVRVERVYLSSDNKCMIGAVLVANLAFHKFVVARFTLDYWKTTSEVVAEYNNDVRQAKKPDGYDRFNFNIKLADLANLEAKTMFFCVKFIVNGHEHWDNNGSTNFQVDFRRKALPQHGKRGVLSASQRPASSLPRSHRKSGSPRPHSVPAFDDFGDAFDFQDFKQPVNQLLGEPCPTLRLPGVRSAVNLSSSTTPQPTGQAFGTRYDFNLSLSAAKKEAFHVLGDRSGIVMKPKPSPIRQPAKCVPDAEDAQSPLTIKPSANFPSGAAAAPRNFPSTAIPGTDPAKLASADKPALASQSYNELLDKYCFYGSNKSSSQAKDGSLKPGQYDGSTDHYALGSVESSTDTSPIFMAPAQSRRANNTSNAQPPAPMVGYVSGTSSSIYGYQHQVYPWNSAHSATAIHG